METISQKHLLGISDLSIDDIETILDRAENYAGKLEDPLFQSDCLAGEHILSLFFEDSTRTRVSFEMAARRLGARWVNIDIARSSVTKGESLRDTVLTLREIVRPSAIIIRHSEKGVPQDTAGYAGCPVINAGDNAHEHPTQALLDALTIRQHKNTLKDLNVAICGDVAHSRVAHSNMILLTKMGANVRAIAPPAFMPGDFPVGGIAKFKTMEDGLPDCDVVMMLRTQKERMAQSDIPAEDRYFNAFGLTAERLALAKPDALVMHPGPMNRDAEIASDIADGPQSVILQQVANGVATRMAVMNLLINK